MWCGPYYVNKLGLHNLMLSHSFGSPKCRLLSDNIGLFTVTLNMSGKRAENFSINEKINLLKLLKKYKDVIECKKK